MTNELSPVNICIFAFCIYLVPHMYLEIFDLIQCVLIQWYEFRCICKADLERKLTQSPQAKFFYFFVISLQTWFTCLCQYSGQLAQHYTSEHTANTRPSHQQRGLWCFYIEWGGERLHWISGSNLMLVLMMTASYLPHLLIGLIY